ncbi:MAG: acyltransferase family protein, partial [Marmoricola sp.]
VTPARVWELGVGALLATVKLLRPGRMRHEFATPLALLGLAAIGYTAATYTGYTPFPGWQAAVPVLGTAAVIAAQPEHGPGSPGPVLALRPIQFLGDISYSVYLWHWPLVVFVPQLTDRPLSWTDRGSILLASLALATVTKALVEDRFRGRHWGIPLRKPFIIAAVAMSLVVSGSVAQLTEVKHRRDEGLAALKRGLAGNDPCFGSPALEHPDSCPSVSYDRLVPSPIDAANDHSDAYAIQKSSGTDCWSYQPHFGVKTCTFGVKRSRTDVVLVGNSHAGQWLPALQRLARLDRFRITTKLASRCAMADLRQQFDTSDFATACLDWVHKVTQQVIDLHPALVVLTNRISTAAENTSLADSTPKYAAGYASVLGAWKAAGLHVLVLRDTPAPGTLIPDCVAQKQSHYSQCDGTRDAWLQPQPEKAVIDALGDPDIRYADLTDHICGPVICHAVTGGVITYFDGSHLTATFATTLAPYLGVPVRQMLRGGAAG